MCSVPHLAAQVVVRSRKEAAAESNAAALPVPYAIIPTAAQVVIRSREEAAAQSNAAALPKP